MTAGPAQGEGRRVGEFCHRHWSWLCQANQGECQREQALSVRRSKCEPGCAIKATTIEECDGEHEAWGGCLTPEVVAEAKAMARRMRGGESS